MIGAGELNPGIIQVDLWENTFDVFDNKAPRPDCPACGLGRYEFLEWESGTQAASLCGRDAVQIRIPGAPQLRLAELVERQRNVSQITAANDYLVRFKVNSYEITLFADARAIIKGTTDETMARSLYSKYVGT